MDVYEEAIDVVNATLIAEYGGWQSPTAERIVRALGDAGLLIQDGEH